MSDNVMVHLNDFFFTGKERTLLEFDGITVSLFRYETSVAALRVRNRRGEIIFLPYQGQQVWSCVFDDRNITMKSMFTQPEHTQDYLRTYGGFLLHCGATAMGVPSKEDTHSLHGELPNAQYQDAFLSSGRDDSGSYVVVGGQYKHTVAFNHNYLAKPTVKIYSDSTLLYVSMQITNLKRTEMELMYMAHINFCPVDHARLVYSADYNPDNVKVSVNIPAHIKTSASIEDFKNFLYKLEKNPELHHNMDPDSLFDPEVIFSIQYRTDEIGMAHNMQVHPDGYADYVAHYPAQLDQAIRWIARTPDQDSLGLVLPANTGNGGYLAEKAAGNIKIIGAGETVRFDLKVGLLNPEEAGRMMVKIEEIK